MKCSVENTFKGKEVIAVDLVKWLTFLKFKLEN